MNKFQRTKSVTDDHTERVVRASGTIQAIKDAINQSPGTPTGRLTTELNVPQMIIWCKLRFNRTE